MIFRPTSGLCETDRRTQQQDARHPTSRWQLVGSDRCDSQSARGLPVRLAGDCVFVLLLRASVVLASLLQSQSMPTTCGRIGAAFAALVRTLAHACAVTRREKLKKRGITPKDYERENKLRLKQMQRQNREQRLREVGSRHIRALLLREPSTHCSRCTTGMYANAIGSCAARSVQAHAVQRRTAARVQDRGATAQSVACTHCVVQTRRLTYVCADA